MKKIITLLLAAGFVTAVSAQQGGRHYDNSYQSSPYAYNDRYRNDRYDDNPQWNERGYHNQFESRYECLERQRYEMMMRRRAQERYYNQRRYESYYPYGYRKPSLQIRIGIGGHSRY